MRGLQLRRNFYSLYDDFRKKLAVIQEASQSLRNSSTFRELLDVWNLYILSLYSFLLLLTLGLWLIVGHSDGGELYE